MRPHLLIWAAVALAAGITSAQNAAPMVPYNPTLIEDEKGNEWYIDQTGGLQRNGSKPSQISSAMQLHLGSHQFYSQQPTISHDGSELELPSPQAVNGLSLTRRISVLKKDAALRYVEEVANTTQRDLTASVNLSHQLGNFAQTLLSDRNRPITDGLKAGEPGLACVADPQRPAPSVLLTICAAGAPVIPKVAFGNRQLMVTYSFTVPAGKTVTLIHGIAQAQLSAKPTEAQLGRAFRPIAMRRLTRNLPKQLLNNAVNARGQSSGSEAWFPAAYWDVAPEASDLLVLDKASRLKGRATLAPASIQSGFGKAAIQWPEAGAVAGPALAGPGNSMIWLRDGQRWRGRIGGPAIKFTMTAGGTIETAHPHLLVFRKPGEAEKLQPNGHTALIETFTGERLAFQAEGTLKADTPWGKLEVPWAEIVAIRPAEKGIIGSTLELTDGTVIRALPVAETIELKTKTFGALPFDLKHLHQAITAQAEKASGAEADPAGPFLELLGDQRLVCRVKTEKLHFLTASGVVEVAPSAIHELRELIRQDSDQGPRQFQADLWGGGQVSGTITDSSVDVEGRGFSWLIPTRHLVRLVNPVPVTDSATLRQIGELIQQLGSPQWSAREQATTQLRELGPLAKLSLREALKQATDPEVTRRIELLLSELD